MTETFETKKVSLVLRNIFELQTSYRDEIY